MRPSTDTTALSSRRAATAGNPLEADIAKRGSVGIVLGDIGGTNVRLAELRDGVLGPVAHMAVADHLQFGDVLAAFMAGRADRDSILQAMFGVAGVIDDDRCALTNNSWVIDARELRDRFGFDRVQLVNDFEAVAWSLPQLGPRHVRQIGLGKPKPLAPMAVLGAGTGLGVAAYVPVGQGATVMRSEGGHTALAGASLREDAIIATLRKQFGYVSAERVLSGAGLENLYNAIASLDSLTAPRRDAAAIVEAARGGNCATSAAALETFCALFGAVAGDFALAFGAQGGVYIAGGIAAHLRDYLPSSQFRTRFDAKGKMSRYVEAIPAYLILHDDPAFLGLSALAMQHA
ncbi:MAG TPA: glucokinase [Xanthobacteraceae bacterium]|nr:glucokinase [Xanthobacteraceae bacterium]